MLSLVAMHGYRLSISSLHLGCRESLLLSLLDRFVSLLLSALRHSTLSCLASGVYMTCFMPRNSSLLLAMMALMPMQLTYQPSVLLLMSRVSTKLKISLIITLVGMVVRYVWSILSSGVGTRY